MLATGDIQAVVPVLVVNELSREATSLHESLVSLITAVDKTAAAVWHVDDLLGHFAASSQVGVSCNGAQLLITCYSCNGAQLLTTCYSFNLQSSLYACFLICL